VIRAVILTLYCTRSALCPSVATAQITGLAIVVAIVAGRKAGARFAPDWDSLDAQRKQNGAASRSYPKMSADEQQRIQGQMKSWASCAAAATGGARAIQVVAAAAAGKEG
jgi:hypothetical protein